MTIFLKKSIPDPDNVDRLESSSSLQISNFTSGIVFVEKTSFEKLDPKSFCKIVSPLKLKISHDNESGTIFTILHSLRNLQIRPIS